MINLTTNLGRLKLLAWLEGISYLALLFVTMPLKYLAALPGPNKMVGYAHGVLFVLYTLSLIFSAEEYGWKKATFWKGFAAAWLPFATFWAEKHLFVVKSEERRVKS